MEKHPNNNAYCLDDFSKSVGRKVLQINALLVVNAILMGVMVGIGAYGHRYRHHPLTRFLFLGATTLFLPIMSYIVSSLGNNTDFIVYSTRYGSITGHCTESIHILLVLVWTALVLIVGINTTTIISCDAREGRNIGPPVVLLVQALWTSYLTVNTTDIGYSDVFSLRGLLLLLPFAIIFAKLLLKFYAWYKARQSFGLGRNPRLIVGYMEQLQDRSHDALPPPLTVMGEDTVLVKKQPRGYSFEHMSNINNGGLVTIDKVWQLDNILIRSTSHLKDICFSFALFKLLRCRFARYTISEAGIVKARNFLWNMLLQDNADERVLGLIAYELSFLHDCYYSSLPISYSKSWLPILSIFISLLSIGHCLFATYILSLEYTHKSLGQLLCLVFCEGYSKKLGNLVWKSFGNIYYDLVPVYLLVALVVLVEAREIASFICSHWTKVSLIGRYSWHQSPIMQKCVRQVLRCKCDLFNHWKDKMKQCSILVLHPRNSVLALLWNVTPLPGKNKKVPRAVKIAIINTLRTYKRSQTNDVTYLSRRQHLQVGDNLSWTFNGNRGTADIMLVCHIATSILKARSHTSQTFSDHKIAAIYLSRYCAYLVGHSPELLPDDDKWCKSLFKAVKKDAKRVLAGGIEVSTPEVEYEKLVKLLTEESNHDVLKNGVKLGKQLVELAEGEEKAWEALAGFWSEMILYVAPSDNLDGHAEAIARGGELITLLWTLLAHIGIFSRADDDDDDAAATAGAPADV